MAGSYFNAIKAKDKLQNEYKDRKIIVIDSLCSSSGYGMLVDDAKICLMKEWIIKKLLNG